MTLILLLAIAGILLLVVLAYRWATSRTSPLVPPVDLVSYGTSDSTSTAARSGREAFTVVSYNLGYLSGLTNNLPVGRSRQLFEDNLATAIAALQSLHPDILGLQEVDLDSHRSYSVNQAEALGIPLGFQAGAIAVNWDKRYVPFPYGTPRVHFRKILSGQAILSHFPIRHHDRVVLQALVNKPFFYTDFYLDRLAQVAELDLEGRSLIVINVHLEAFDEPTRRSQTQTVQQLLRNYAPESPVLLLGDFNSTLPTTERPNPTIQLLLDDPLIRPAFLLQAGDPAASPGEMEVNGAIATFPSNQPTMKLDYIFYTPATIEALSCRVVSAAQQASDHLPIMMAFRLK